MIPEYRRIPITNFLHIIKKEIKENIVGEVLWNQIELFGAPRKGHGCTIKLSDQIIEVFNMNPSGNLSSFVTENLPIIEANRSLFRYSKDLHGAAMLNRIIPELVASRCQYYFAPVYRKINQLNT
ncbi:hypothetical protein PCURB6_40950 [Paenibacillus curdlanolyticus]|nr:hypothetical protein PCURB6_40950 [Paenibacillus curdlanolyticus]